MERNKTHSHNSFNIVICKSEFRRNFAEMIFSYEFSSTVLNLNNLLIGDTENAKIL